MFVSVIVVAGGLGLRMKSDTPKQFLKIGSKQLISYTLEKLLIIDEIDEIILTLPENDFAKWRNELKPLTEKLHIKKVVKGGLIRQGSVYNGFEVRNKSAGVVVIHDAVRPFFEPKTIVDGIKLLEKYDGAVCAIPMNDTVKKVNDENVINKTIDRSGLFRAQTPQMFKTSVLERAFINAIKSGKTYTDESSMAEAVGATLKIIEGSENNIKITSAEDLRLAEYLLNNIKD